MKMPTWDGTRVLRLRQKLGLNQHEFWTLLSVTQSGGSRYESGRGIPRPTQILLELVFGSNPQRLLKDLRGFGETTKK